MKSELPDTPRKQTKVTPPAEGWIIAGRPGYAGGGWKRRAEEQNLRFGEGSWRIGHLWQGETLDRDGALALYEEAYYQHFLAQPTALDWICATASEVYDIEPSNVESGLDYHKQESAAIHLQDISVRRCLQRLQRQFVGDHLVQIRGQDSEGYRLNPGQVPFHAPDAIIKPSLQSWWKEDSVEDFWQSNKVMQVRADVPESVLRPFLLKKLPRAQKNEVAVALFGGSFNPIHHGHLRLAQELVDLYGFSKVIFVPNGNNYSKKGLIDEKHRARMVELAIASESRFEWCDFELNREETAHTHQTLEYIEGRLSDEYEQCNLYLLRGSDVIGRMLRWKSLPTLLRCKVVVPMRPNSDPWEAFGQEEMFRLHHDRFCLMDREYEDGLSSTLVRERLGQGLSARYLVPVSVEDYISEHGLYDNQRKVR